MSKPWLNHAAPKRILAIRLQAMGDMVITLPYLQALKKSLPADVQLDFLTRDEVASIPQNLALFDHIYCIGGGRNFKLQILHAAVMLPGLMLRRYDVVLDLQNNVLSRLVRQTLRPKAWCAFDRFSPLSAGERNRQTLNTVGLVANLQADYHLTLKSTLEVNTLLVRNGWIENRALVVLNPAGAFENRNWPVECYAAFARLWLLQYPETQFLILGIDKVAAKAKILKQELGDTLIDLTNKTTPAQAFALIQQIQLMLSEDSGLMHMAWVSGVPTMALFGSTRSDWARPLGNHTFFLDSADLECGSCMLEVCKHTGLKQHQCMTRYTALQVFEEVRKLYERSIHKVAGTIK